MALSEGAVLAVALGVVTTASAATGGGTGVSLTATPKPLDFGSQEIGTTSAPQTLTITNTGSAPVDIYFLDTESPDGRGYGGTAFAEYTGTLPPSDGCSEIVLAPGASCSESYTFAPFNLGPQAADVDVEGNATPGGESQTEGTFPITGKGTSPGAFVGSITLPSGVAQNGVVGGQSVTATVNLSSSPGGSKCVSFHEPITVALNIDETTDAANAPSQVVVPADQCSANFTVTTNPTTSDELVSILGTVPSDPNAFEDYRGVGLDILP